MNQRFGDAVARSFGLDSAPLLETRSLRGSQIVASRLRCGPEHVGMTELISPEDTYAVGINLIELPRYELWSKGRLQINSGFAVDSMRIGHLVDKISIRTFQPSDSVVFHISRAALDEITNEEGLATVGTLICEPGIVDPAMARLTRTMLPYFDRPQEASSLFVDHLTLTIASYLIHQYSDNKPRPAVRIRGYLSPEQMSRVQEMLAGDLRVSVSQAEIARELGIPQGRLIRQFKKEMGFAPSRWLLWKRVDTAKGLLKNTTHTINEISFLCGFADQSHMTRAFREFTKMTPGVWRAQSRR